MKNKKQNNRKKRALPIILIVLAVIYLTAAQLIMTFTMVPSFMEKMDAAFSSLTQKGMSEQVVSEEIEQNEDKAWDDTLTWLDTLDWRKLKMASDDGADLIAAEFRQEDPAAPWILLLHGYTGSKEELYPYACRYFARGYSLLVPDLRAQGESGGKYIGMGVLDRADLLKWLSYINREYPDAPVILCGQSMGASAALMLGADPALPGCVKAVISDCAFTDALSLFKNKEKDWIGIPDPGLIDTAGLLLKLEAGYGLKEASALQAMAKSSLPTLFIHGEEDRIVPLSNAYSLYNTCTSQQKKLLTFPGAGHAQSADKDPEKYYDAVFSFIDSVLQDNAR